MSIYVIAALTFSAVLLGVAAVAVYVSRSPNRIEARLRSVRQGGVTAMSSGTLMGDRLLVMDAETFGGTRARLVQASFRGPNSVLWFYVVRLACATIMAPAAFVSFRAIGATGPLLFLGTVAAGLGGYALPAAYVSDRVAKRREAIRAAVPNVLDLIIVCVEAGLSLNAAIQRIAQDMKYTYPELAWELTILNQEIFIGKSRAEAFRNLARRTGVDELRSLATVLLQSDRLGTGIAELLRVQATTLRLKRRQMAMETAQKMPIKLLFPLILCIFPEMLVVLLGPGGLQVYRALTSSFN